MLRLLKHQLAFVLPLSVLLYVWTAPHSPLWVVLLSLPLVLVVLLDAVASPDRTDPPALPALPFDLTMLGLAAVHVANLVGLVLLPGRGATALDMVVGVILTGSSTGYTAIVLSHELIHRREQSLRLLGRALLATALYEHFYTEHLRGHHVRVATPADPATARFDEPLWRFLLRTLPAQLRSAWSLEQRRTKGRLRQNRVLHGLIAGLGLLAVVGLCCGPLAALVWVGQAAVGVLLLEVVNYFEHWGLQRQERGVTPADSWDAESWWTYYALVGLSRHADHHAAPSRPYPALRPHTVSPKLPWGYFATAVVGIFANRVLRARLRAELQRIDRLPTP